MRRSFLFVAVLAAAPALHAQSIFDTSIRGAPQFVSYSIAQPSNLKISEFAIPFFVLMPLSQSITLDAGSSYASARVERTTGGVKTTSNISGLTDTQIRLNVALGTDFVVLTGGLNLPTGQSTATLAQQSAATLIGNDFLSFPISNMGTGLGGTGGIALARPLGAWNLGAGVSVRRSEAYDPFEQTDGTALRYQPGDEYRARVGLDHPLGTGHVQFGVTYSKFGDDDIAGSIYNTGDRYLSQASVTNTVGAGDLTLVGWDLYRTAGTLADGATSQHENIANALVGLAFQAGGVRIEPTVEARSWMQVAKPASTLGNVGLRFDTNIGPFGVSPSATYTMGKIASADNAGANTTANLTGFRGTLTIRIR